MSMPSGFQVFRRSAGRFFYIWPKPSGYCPLLWHRLRQKGLDKAVPIAAAETFKNAFRQNTLHNLRFYGELRRLLSVLKPEGIPLILLKGVFLADAVYSNMGVREMNDIDVLARPADLARIAEILTGMGYTPLSPISVDTTLKNRQLKRGRIKPRPLIPAPAP